MFLFQPCAIAAETEGQSEERMEMVECEGVEKPEEFSRCTPNFVFNITIFFSIERL